MKKTKRKGGGIQLDLLAPADDRRAELTRLMEEILQDRPDASTAQVAAEMVRACVGVGDYALPVPVPESELKYVRRKH